MALAHKALERYGLRGASNLPADGGHAPCSDAKVPAPPPRRPSLEQLRAQLLWRSVLARETPLLVPEAVPTIDGSLMAYALL